MKNCSKKDIGCPNHNPQPLDNFNKNKTMKDGYAYECRDCMKLYRKEHRKTKKHKESRAKWEEENPNSVKRSKKKYYNKTKDKWTNYNRDYYERNKTNIREYQKTHYHNNLEEMHTKQKQRRNKKPVLYAYSDYKNRSKKKKMDFELSIEEFADLVNSPCHYCLRMVKAINGIDRIDSNLGYIPDNCVPCCSTCNTMKMTMSYQDFLSHILLIADRFDLL